MKGLIREHLIEAIKVNYKKGEVIFENDETLDLIFEQLGDSYFMVDGNLKITEKANIDWKDGE